MERSTRSATLAAMKLIAAAAPASSRSSWPPSRWSTTTTPSASTCRRRPARSRRRPGPRGPGAPAAPLSFAELYDRVDGVVARVDARRAAEDPPFDNGRRVATGAAFLVDDEGHLVTNAHVVDGRGRPPSASAR